MKKLFLAAAFTVMSLGLLAQNAPADVVYKVNGEEMKGKVTKVTDADIHFVYAGETLEYTIKKSDIAKILHSSGRVEVISGALPAEVRKGDAISMSASPVDHHNKIAILPFTYLMDREPAKDEMGMQVQQDAFNFLSKHSAGFTIMDPRTTNAMLAKAGATKEKLMTFTTKELCDILGVEYVIDGSVAQNKGYQTASSNTNVNTNVKRDDNTDKVKKVQSSSNTNSYAAQRYDVTVSLHIFMDNNASIYNQSHQAFLSSTDADYSSPLEYLLKRCPLYRK